MSGEVVEEAKPNGYYGWRSHTAVLLHRQQELCREAPCFWCGGWSRLLLPHFLTKVGGTGSSKLGQPSKSRCKTASLPWRVRSRRLQLDHIAQALIKPITLLECGYYGV